MIAADTYTLLHSLPLHVRPRVHLHLQVYTLRYSANVLLPSSPPAFLHSLTPSSLHLFILHYKP